MVVKRKRVRRQLRRNTIVDRLSDMPESIQLHILSSLDVRHAVNTSMLSKSWVSSWTCMPSLNFNSDCFRNLHVFDNFVVNALRHRQPVKLDKLTFKYGGTCDYQILEKLFDYAFSHGVEELEANIAYLKSWPIGLHTVSDTLTSLQLEADRPITDCSFLEPRSVSFKNLTSLHLKRVYIKDLDPFSGFPVLCKLRLVACFLRTKGNALNIHALQLSELSIVHYTQHILRFEITTPKLRYFEWRGSNILQVNGDLPIVDTVVIDYYGYCFRKQEKMMFDDLLKLFSSLHNAKSLTIFSSIVHLLTLFPYEMANQCSPFQDLKCLKLAFTEFRNQKAFEGLFGYQDVPEERLLEELLQLVPAVKAYLLPKSHDAKCTIILN